MSVDTHQLRELLMQSDQEFRELALKHHELDDRLHELSSRTYLTESEQIEEIQLKKRKLQLKDRMEHILQRHR
ncbi:MAG TPA: YdcH family protein [Vicinamibacterales bacterium]|nr:YdcH family protein [Vicinamibacterales bacterium]